MIAGMKNAFQKIEQRQKQLARSAFCAWLNQVGLDQDALRFAPSMTYFVLGFRDILALAKRERSVSESVSDLDELDLAINTHCEEDREHWKWFLSDIEKLGYLNTTPEKFLFRIWSDEEQMPRRMIYHITHLIQSETDSRLILVMIECLEAAFAVFIESLKPQLVKRGFYEKLTYFGQKHDLGEQSHAMGSWIEDQAAGEKGSKSHVPHPASHEAHGDTVVARLASSPSSPELESQAARLVDSIFNHFEMLFEHWRRVALSSGGAGLPPEAIQKDRR